MTTNTEIVAAINEIRRAAAAPDGTVADTPVEASSALARAEYYMNLPGFSKALLGLSGGRVNLNGDNRVTYAEVVAWASTLTASPEGNIDLTQDTNLRAARELKSKICGCSR